ncbi:MAG: TIGR04283 family arsenosugar biosynthesis glycosyltransferase [Verrucomicrobiae bacterium]|nr:TIGR04283 family arsenosugar biosynthesis glycosyltransferase [Verrucomicrobiae bacterium]
MSTDAHLLIAVYLGMALTGIAVWAFFPNLDSKRSVLLILALALISRVLMAGFPASDDVNRYLWEGRLLLAGESPYEFTADDQEWLEYRDSYWEKMNHRDKLTAYPPLALAVFATLNLISYHPWIYKVFFGFADLVALGVLVGILWKRKLPVRNALFYALNPVTIIGFSGEAHFDSLFILTMLAALLAWEHKRVSLAWLLLGLSVQIKIISVLLIPLLLWRGKSLKALWILVPLCLPCLGFWQDLPNLFSGIVSFGGTMSHNGSINHLLIDFFGSRETASRLSLAILAIVVLLTSLRCKDILKGSFIIMGALILVAPTIHYWYLVWVLPFVALFPSLPWLVLLTLSGFYFVAWVMFGKTGEWYQPIGYLRMQWIPFYVLWAPWFIRGLKKLFTRLPYPDAKAISVVIPVLNEAENLRTCLQSIQRSMKPFREVIVVDGGSTDDTASVAKACGAKFLQAERGRGYQIAHGVSQCTGDVILVLHSDARIPVYAADSILSVLNKNPEVAGGAMGQRFISTKPKPVLVLIEALNDFRAQCLGNSFGDQGQFFRRSAIEHRGGYPKIPLMEDVELASQLHWEGDLVLLNCDLTCSARRWEREKSLKRILQVIGLVVRYKLLKCFGKDASRKLFEEYYPK